MLRKTRILADRVIYRGLATSQADTPSLVSPTGRYLQDQDEQGLSAQAACPWQFG